MSSKTLKYGLAAAAVGSSMLFALPAVAAALTESQITAITALLSSFGADAAVVANVTTVLHGGTPTNTGTSTSWGKPKLPAMWMGSSSPLMYCPQFKHDFRKGDSDGKNEGEVSKLQKYLKESGVYTGPVTGFFGPLTDVAFKKWHSMATSSASTTPNVTIIVGSPRALFARFCGNIKQNIMEDRRGGLMGSTTPPVTGTTTASTTPN